MNYFEYIPEDIIKFIILKIINNRKYADIENLIDSIHHLDISSYVDDNLFIIALEDKVLVETYKLYKEDNYMLKYNLYKTLRSIKLKYIKCIKILKEELDGIFCTQSGNLFNLKIFNIKGIDYNGIIRRHIKLLNLIGSPGNVYPFTNYLGEEIINEVYLSQVQIIYDKLTGKYRIVFYYLIVEEVEVMYEFTESLSENQISVLLSNIIYSGPSLTTANGRDIMMS